jgi:hypothetical protein
MSTNRFDRLNADRKRLELLAEKSDGRWSFEPMGVADPPEAYLITMKCKGVARRFGVIKQINVHQVALHLGTDYPIGPPRMVWRTPIYHPNIYQSAVCVVSRWTSKMGLDEFCVWLWDMARYALYNENDMIDGTDVKLKEWVIEQKAKGRFPLDGPLHEAKSASGPPVDAGEGAPSRDISAIDWEKEIRVSEFGPEAV